MAYIIHCKSNNLHEEIIITIIITIITLTDCFAHALAVDAEVALNSFFPTLFTSDGMDIQQRYLFEAILVVEAHADDVGTW